jgi:hypothetical protein
MALIIGIERSRAMRRSQNYAQDCLAGLIGDLQALTANVYLVETLLAQNLINDPQNSGTGAVDVVEEQSFIVDDGSRIGLEMKEIARHGHLTRSLYACRHRKAQTTPSLSLASD